MTKLLIKILSWLVFIISGFFLMKRFDYWVSLAISLHFAGFHMILWINDKEKGRLL